MAAQPEAVLLWAIRKQLLPAYQPVILASVLDRSVMQYGTPFLPPFAFVQNLTPNQLVSRSEVVFEELTTNRQPARREP